MDINAIHLPGLLLALEQLATAGLARENRAYKALMGLIGEAEAAWGRYADVGGDGNSVVQVLVQAEQFVAGFEGDWMQEGVEMLLAELRAGATVAKQWSAFIDECRGQAGGMVNGNRLSLRASELLALPACAQVAVHG